MELYTCNSTGRVRRLWYRDREYFVAPLTSIVEGVLPGSQGHLFYPRSEMSRNVSGWDDVIITINHPYDPATGAPLSARDKGVRRRQGVGFLRNSRMHEDGTRLQHQAWVDVERVKKICPKTYNALRLCADTGQCVPMEQSTGLYTYNDPATNGSHFNGRLYTHTARNYKPDHLALLPDAIGACSVRDGCGLLVNEGGAGGGGMGDGGDHGGQEMQTSPTVVKKGVKTAKASLLDRIQDAFTSNQTLEYLRPEGGGCSGDT